MGILDKFFPTRTATTTAGGSYYPTTTDSAITRTGTAIRDSGTAVLNKGVEIYKANPKKIQALGVLAGAILLASMKKRS
jgi:hypothetical protein